MKKFIKYPSIEQFRNTVKAIQMSASYVGKDEEGNPIYDGSRVAPELVFQGRVKLHGTNASICYNSVEGVWAQSRNSIITVDSDNAGFAFYVETNKQELVSSLLYCVPPEVNLQENTATLYGEWCGGNIQKGVAINGLPKMFVVFGCKITPHDETKPAYWVDSYTPSKRDINLYHVNDFWKTELAIDFNRPEHFQNRLIEITEFVEENCPAGVFFGVNGVGEGVVWSLLKDGVQYQFKVKGEKHSSSKVKKLASVDIEKVKNVDDFVELAVTENRLEQGIEQVFTSTGREPDKKLTGEFVKWITTDILKEELDTLAGNGLEPKDVMGKCSKKAANWFMNKL